MHTLWKNAVRWIPVVGIMCGCAALPQPLRGQDVRVTVDLAKKTAAVTNVLAVKESVPLRIVNLGASSAASLAVQLVDRDANVRAVQNAWTNDAGSAVSVLNLNTAGLVSDFADRSPQGTVPYTLLVWDTVLSKLLVNAPVTLQNNLYGNYPAPDQLTNYTFLTSAAASAFLADAQTAANGAGLVASNAYTVATNNTADIKRIGAAATNAQQVASNAAAGVVSVGAVATSAYSTATGTVAVVLNLGASVTNAQVTASNALAIANVATSALPSKLSTNGVRVGGGGGITITNANGLQYISATGTASDTNVVGSGVSTSALLSVVRVSTNLVFGLSPSVATSGQWNAAVNGVGAGATSLVLAAWATASNGLANSTNALAGVVRIGAAATNAQVVASNAAAGVVSVGLVASNGLANSTNALVGVVRVGAAATNAQVVASNAAATIVTFGASITNAQVTASNAAAGVVSVGLVASNALASANLGLTNVIIAPANYTGAVAIAGRTVTVAFPTQTNLLDQAVVTNVSVSGSLAKSTVSNTLYLTGTVYEVTITNGMGNVRVTTNGNTVTSAINITNVASGGIGSITGIATTVSGLGVLNAGGPQATITGAVATVTDTNDVRSIINASTNISARLLSNVWDIADSTTNYVRRTGDNITGNLVVDAAVPDIVNFSVTGSGISGYADSGGTEFIVDITGFRVLGRPFIGSGAGLTSLDSGALTNLGSGLAISSGQLIATNTTYAYGDIRAYGASTNADATAAIASALSINNTIYIPPGTWTASNIVITGTKTIYGLGFDSYIFQATNAVGSLINAGTSGTTLNVVGIRISGGSEISRQTNTVVGTRHGIQYSTQDNGGGRFERVWISGFSGYGIFGTETNYTGNYNDPVRISQVTVSNCFGGIMALGRSEMVNILSCFASWNAVGFRAGAGNVQIVNSIAANNGIDYDVNATAPNDAHGLMSGCGSFGVPGKYALRVSTNTLGFVFTGNKLGHGGILLEQSRGALFVGNQFLTPFVADRGGGGGTNFFINNLFYAADNTVLSNSAGTIYHAGNFDTSGNRMWGELEPLYSLPSTVATTLQLTGLSGTLANGRLSLTNTASSGGATNAWTLIYNGTTSTPTQVEYYAGNNMSVTGGVVGSTAKIYFASSGTGGSSSASAYVSAGKVNVYQPVIGTQNAMVKIGFTNVEYDTTASYNVTNWTLMLPTGKVTFIIRRGVLSQGANMMVGIFKNNSEIDPLWDTGRIYQGVDGISGNAGAATHTYEFINRETTNYYDVRCLWSAATRTAYGWFWAWTVQQ